jgi:hypothetical protein
VRVSVLVEFDATDAHFEIDSNLLTVVLPDRPPYPSGRELLNRSRFRKLRKTVTLFGLGVLTTLKSNGQSLAQSSNLNHEPAVEGLDRRVIGS